MSYSRLPHSTPYAARPNRRVDNWHDRDRIHVTVRRDRVPPQRGGAGNSQDGISKSWFKITVSIWEVDGAGEVGAGGWAQSKGVDSSHHKISLLSCLLHSQVSILSPEDQYLRTAGSEKEWEGLAGLPGKERHLKGSMVTG